MRRVIYALGICAMPFLAHSQGTVNFLNSTSTFIRTNATAVGGTAGNTAATLGGFFYGVFTAPSTVTSIDTSLQNLLTPTWTFTGLYGTNIAATSGGRLSGGSGVATQTGWQPGETNSFLVLGWSGNLGAKDWTTLRQELTGATFSGGAWSGPNLIPSGGGAGFLGASLVSFGQAGGGTAGLPAFSLFGTVPTPQGNPTGGFDLFVIAPEPGTVSLFGLAFMCALSLRARRRH